MTETLIRELKATSANMRQARCSGLADLLWEAADALQATHDAPEGLLSEALHQSANVVDWLCTEHQVQDECTDEACGKRVCEIVGCLNYKRHIVYEALGPLVPTREDGNPPERASQIIGDMCMKCRKQKHDFKLFGCAGDRCPFRAKKGQPCGLCGKPSDQGKPCLNPDCPFKAGAHDMEAELEATAVKARRTAEEVQEAARIKDPAILHRPMGPVRAPAPKEGERYEARQWPYADIWAIWHPTDGWLTGRLQVTGIATALSREKELEEALGWYAEPAHYAKTSTTPNGPVSTAVQRDGGERARAALAKARGE